MRSFPSTQAFSPACYTRMPTKPVLALALACASLLSACGTTSDRIDRSQEDVSKVLGRVSGHDRSLIDQVPEAFRGSVERHDRLAAEQRARVVARRAAQPYIGSVMVPVTSEDKLPSVFFEPFVLDLTEGLPATTAPQIPLGAAMARLSRSTNIPVRLSPDVYVGTAATQQGSVLAAANPSAAAGARSAVMLDTPPPPPSTALPPSPLLTNSGAAAPLFPQAQSSGVPRQATALGAASASASTAPTLNLLPVEMRFSGSLSAWLNMVTDRLGLSWEFREGTIVVMRFVSELHEVYTLDASSDSSMSTSSSGSGGGGGGGASNNASSAMSVSEKSKYDPITSIEKSLQLMMRDVPGSEVQRTEGSGRFLVKTTREMQGRIRDYIRMENASMRRQAQIQFDVYSVVTDVSDERGVDWSVLLNNAASSVGMQLSTPPTLTGALTGGASVTVLPNIFNSRLSQLFGNSGAFIGAMAQQGYSVQYRPVSLLALNRRWARASKMSTEGYLSETTPGAASGVGGVGAPGLKTSSITTGDQYVANAQIMDDSTVLLNFGMSLSDLLGLFDVSSGSGATLQKVQVPRVTAVNAQFPVAIRPGELVAVTGLSRVISVRDRRAFGEDLPIILGGSRKENLRREHFIILIRPTVMVM